MEKAKTKITLSDFVDFSIKNGLSRLTKIKEIKAREEYHPGKDYWKKFRDGIVNFHKNKHSEDYLNHIVNEITEARKKNYENAINTYKNFIGKKDIQWFNPKKDDWHFSNSSIRVNPELGLVISNEPHVIKLYFKEDKSKPETILDKRKLSTIFFLMEDTLSYDENYKYSIYNVKTGKLITKNKSPAGIKKILESDILSLEHLLHND
ncbi:hypothetical protein [Fictibacillus terranigra]|uniref:Uncharacterized protein n=1 Tax=Fictibacillus terranigra TaxID=3058424 RepID=A0ABT8EAQ3_9BACL|nr:hypothetical protein [Fictibacillus sp. CENA-BCM004]MDN4074944.1 hypothetical protein [Fictibacillus sp. CENA-BCM004]